MINFFKSNQIKSKSDSEKVKDVVEEFNDFKFANKPKAEWYED